MDVYLSIDNRAEVIQLPVRPSEFEIRSGSRHMTFETLQGELKLPGPRALATIRLPGRFPADGNLPYIRGTLLKPWEYVDRLNRWRDSKKPIRLIIGSVVNMAVIIEDFDHGMNDGSGDVWFELNLSEFRFVKV